MRARRTRWIAAAVVLGAAAYAPPVRAFTMGEQLATTGIQGNLAATGSANVAGTISGVKGKLAASAPQLPNMGGSGQSGLRTGRPGGAHAGSSNSGWGGATKGWAKQGEGGGGAKGGWAGPSGGWAQANSWSGQGKAWSTTGKGGAGGWARPGGKSG